MQVWQDEVGNICGRYEAAEAGAPALLLGSHLDTVRNAGRYDGMLGVLSAIETVQWLNEHQRRLPLAIEVIGFGDEEAHVLALRCSAVVALPAAGRKAG